MYAYMYMYVYIYVSTYVCVSDIYILSVTNNRLLTNCY